MDPSYKKIIKWVKYHHAYIFIQQKQVSIWQAHQHTNPTCAPMEVCRNGGELLGDLLPSVQLGVCQRRAYLVYYQRSSHQVSIFFLSYNQSNVKDQLQILEVDYWTRTPILADIGTFVAPLLNYVLVVTHIERGKQHHIRRRRGDMDMFYLKFYPS